MIEAMANGCVVVTEPSEGHRAARAGRPLRRGSGCGHRRRARRPPRRRDPARRPAGRCAGCRHGTTVDAGRDRATARRIEVDVLPALAHHVETSNPTRGLWRLGASKIPPHAGSDRSARTVAAEHCEAARARRRPRAAQVGLRCLRAPPRRDAAHRAQRDAGVRIGDAPDVSVVVTLYNYDDVVGETLASIVASHGRSLRDRRRRGPLHRLQPRGRACVHGRPSERADGAPREGGERGPRRSTEHGFRRGACPGRDGDRRGQPRHAAMPPRRSPTRCTPTRVPTSRTESSRSSERRPVCAARSPGTPSSCAAPTTSMRRR